MEIVREVCPITGKPYVSLQVVQAAHWEYSLLQHTITYRPGTPSSPTKAHGKELEIALHTPDLLATPSNLFSSGAKRYFPVPGDSSTRIGDSTGLAGASMDQLFESQSRNLTAGGSGAWNQRNSQVDGFGLEQRAYFPAECLRLDPHGKTRWSPYAPLRFGVEFWDVDSLRERSRLHSHTVWHAGSLWNVYVQVVRKKNVQLGVYLHRQSSIEPIPVASVPLIFPMRSLSNVRSMQHMSSPSESHSSTPSRSSTPYSGATPSTSPGRPSSLPSSYSVTSINSSRPVVNTVPATAPSAIPLQSYRDPRPKVSAYFTISCASATGSSLTRFTSAPDEFSISQSWGWKSSSLRTEEYLEVGEDGMTKSVSPMGKMVSLRATVVVGLV